MMYLPESFAVIFEPAIRIQLAEMGYTHLWCYGLENPNDEEDTMYHLYAIKGGAAILQMQETEKIYPIDESIITEMEDAADDLFFVVHIPKEEKTHFLHATFV